MPSQLLVLAPLLCEIYMLVWSLLKVLKKLVPELSQEVSLEYESCQMGKHHHVPYPLRVNKRVDHPFELVHSNIWVLILLVQRSVTNILLSLWLTFHM